MAVKLALDRVVAKKRRELGLDWRPLFAIADAVGEDWPERIQHGAAILASRESESTGTLLLADIKKAYEVERKEHPFC